MNLIILSSNKIQPYKLINDYENKNCDLNLLGGQSIFIGYMRKSNIERSDVTSMKLEYYPEMTHKYLEELGNKTKQEYKLKNVLIVHRIGEVFPSDCLVIVACWSKHRKESIQAVKSILEDLKHNAPLWKKEYYSDKTSKWVENNT